MASCIKENPGPLVAVIALSPVKEAPVMAHMEEISSSICMNLPPRSAIIGRLHSAWQNISGVEQISRITLHYLNGRLHVEVYLPIEIADPTTRAQALAERLTQAAAGIEDVETVKVFYG